MMTQHGTLFCPVTFEQRPFLCDSQSLYVTYDEYSSYSRTVVHRLTVCSCQLQAYKNNVYLLPKELHEKVTKLHIPHSVQSHRPYSRSSVRSTLLSFTPSGRRCQTPPGQRASFRSSELSAHQMAPSGVIAHQRGLASRRDCVLVTAPRVREKKRFSQTRVGDVVSTEPTEHTLVSKDQINRHGCSRQGSCPHCLSVLEVARPRHLTRSACSACDALCRLG